MRAALSHLELPTQTAKRVHAAMTPAASSARPFLASSSSPANMSADSDNSFLPSPWEMPSFYACALEEVRKLAAQLREEEIESAAWESDMDAKYSQLKQEIQHEEQLQSELELLLAPSLFRYSAAKGLQHCLTGKKACPHRRFAQQLLLSLAINGTFAYDDHLTHTPYLVSCRRYH